MVLEPNISNSSGDSVNISNKHNSPDLRESFVISGLAGTFPKSHDVHELAYNLYNKINMVEPSKRLGFQDPNLPPSDGTIPDELLTAFDAGYFGIHSREAETADIASRLFMEKVVECVMDAGLHPSDLENTNTGIFVGCSQMSTESLMKRRCIKDSGQLRSALKTMLAGRAAYLFKTKGPALLCDTACSTSLCGLDVALNSLRAGECDAAIVASVNVFTEPNMTLQFHRLGVLSPDGVCKSFDKDGNGYARSETVAALFIQKEKDALRVYAKLLHGKTNCDGYKEMGITYPSGEDQCDLMTDVWRELGISPLEVSYLEAHGTGTTVGDPEECKSIDSVFTKGRDGPLLVGSVKSNLGHSEPSSGICSIAKCILAFETGQIAPNLHFNQPKETITSIKEGRIKILTEATPFPDNRHLVGINSFGFGGVNVHIVLQGIAREKVIKTTDNVPRLVCVSGRTGEAAKQLLDSITKKEVDLEYIAMLHNIFRKNFSQHQYKGYSIISGSKEIARQIREVKTTQQPLTIIFGEMKNWKELAQDFAAVPLFQESLTRLRQCGGKNIAAFSDVIFSNKLSVHQENHLLGAATVELCIANVLKELNLKPTNTCGYGYGQVICAYFDDVITLQEAGECLSILSSQFITKGDKKTKGDDNNNYISNVKNGLDEKHEDIENDLNDSKIDPLNLRKILRPELRKKYFSADYLTEASLKRFSDCVRSKGLILEIGASEVDRSRSMKNTNSLSFNTLEGFLEILGRIYCDGHVASLAKLYPKVQLPVSRGTEMISPHIKWKHDRIWPYDVTDNIKYSCTSYVIDVREKVWTYITGHSIDGRILFPAAGYLSLAWQSLSIIKNFDLHTTNVSFRSCRFMRATSLPANGSVRLTITHMEDGSFDIVEGDSVVVSGKIVMLDKEEKLPAYLELTATETSKMEKKDIYKELRLRGYNYNGEFRALEESNVSGTAGKIFWNKNWIPFIDNMFQLQLLHQDTRLLYVPTFLQKLTIFPQDHYRAAARSAVNSYLDATMPIYYQPETLCIRSGGIVVEGLQASSIARKKPLGVPVLEKYQFVPNEARLTLNESIRVAMQIILENSMGIKITSVELVDQNTPSDPEILSTIVTQVLGDQPLIQAEQRIYTERTLETDILVENKTLTAEDDYSVVIGSKLLLRKEILKAAIQGLKDNGYIITREDPDVDTDAFTNEEVHIITVHQTSTEKIILLARIITSSPVATIAVSSEDTEFEWLTRVQEVVGSNKEVILYSQDEPLGGLLGFVNCIRREPDTGNVRGVITYGAKPFDMEDEFYKKQLNKNLAINVYKDGAWGTYRHLLLEDVEDLEHDHCYVNQTARGDLSSLRWIEGPIVVKESDQTENPMIKVHYAALNFRDVMTASGKINADVITLDRLEQECVQGFEFSGYTMSGEKVMGMVSYGALSTLVTPDKNLLMRVPESWSMEEAATVPVVYGTIIYALKLRGNMRRGESILIHSGLGGVGQAAIRYALHHGLEVFATVGSESRKEELRKIFPELKASHIGNSHDVTFEQMIMRETFGKGVDMVLNSLAEEKLLASVRCLARGGRFLEIGKFDISANHHLNLALMEKECSFHGVMLDKLFSSDALSKRSLCDLILAGIEDGSVKPLSSTVFKFDEVEKAFRFMAAGKHMGKVVVEVRSTEKQNERAKLMAMPRYYCKPNRSYIIIGGLGGLGLEIVDWMIIRGARKFVLTSRNGVKNGYQMSRLRTWARYGVTIKVSTSDVTTREGCERVIKEAQELGPVEAVFNLAAVLQDGVFQNQTREMFATSLAPKAYATKHLDHLTRKMCPNLRDFVVFSSVSCGRGNPGQTNYGMANSVMERVCEERRKDGLPGLAIEWGAVGDVGLVADMQESDTELEISGTLQQRVSSCIQVMDLFLRQKTASIVSSMVVAEKKSTILAAATPLDLVVSILDISDIKSISPLSTLAEVGMDSMTAVEIRQSLERDFDITLDAKEIRNLTFARLIELSNSKESAEETTDSANQNLSKGLASILVDSLLPSESEFDNIVMELNSTTDVSVQPVFVFPGMEGYPKLFQHLADNLKVPAVSFNYNYKNPKATIFEEAESYAPLMERYLKKEKPFTIVSHSYGSVVAIEVVRMLELKGYSGRLISIDGAEMVMKSALNDYLSMSNEDFEIYVCLAPFANRISTLQLADYQERLQSCATKDRATIVQHLLQQAGVSYTVEYLNTIHAAMMSRMKALLEYEPITGPVRSKIVLCRPEERILTSVPDDYNLSRQCSQQVEVRFYQGNHTTVLQNGELIDYINSCCSE